MVQLHEVPLDLTFISEPVLREPHCQRTPVHQLILTSFSELGLWKFLTKRGLVLHCLSNFVLWFRRLLSKLHIYTFADLKNRSAKICPAGWLYISQFGNN